MEDSSEKLEERMKIKVQYPERHGEGSEMFISYEVQTEVKMILHILLNFYVLDD